MGGTQNLETYEPVPGLPGALPELSNNFFNLEPGHIPLPNMPPPASLMVPPMFGPPPPIPPFFFGATQIPAYAPPTAEVAAKSTSTVTSAAVEAATSSAAAPPVVVGKPVVHYPSQDPARLGATQLHADRQE